MIINVDNNIFIRNDKTQDEIINKKIVMTPHNKYLYRHVHGERLSIAEYEDLCKRIKIAKNNFSQQCNIHKFKQQIKQQLRHLIKQYKELNKIHESIYMLQKKEHFLYAYTKFDEDGSYSARIRENMFNGKNKDKYYDRHIIVEEMMHTKRFKNIYAYCKYVLRAIKDKDADKITNCYIAVNNFSTTTEELDIMSVKQDQLENTIKNVEDGTDRFETDVSVKKSKIQRKELDVVSTDRFGIDCDNGYVYNGELLHYVNDKVRNERNNEAANKLKNFGASLIVMSKNGPQAWFYFDKTYIFDNKKMDGHMSLQFWKNLVNIVVDCLQKYVTKRVDSSCKLATQILRMPCSLHMKYDKIEYTYVKLGNFWGRKTPQEYLQMCRDLYKQHNDKIGIAMCDVALANMHTDVLAFEEACIQLGISPLRKEISRNKSVGLIKRNEKAHIREYFSKQGLYLAQQETFQSISDKINELSPEFLLNVPEHKSFQHMSIIGQKRSTGSFSGKSSWFFGKDKKAIIHDTSFGKKDYHNLTDILTAATTLKYPELIKTIAGAYKTEIINNFLKGNTLTTRKTIEEQIDVLKEAMLEAHCRPLESVLKRIKTAMEVLYYIINNFGTTHHYKNLDENVMLLTEAFFNDMCKIVIHKNNLLYNKLMASNIINGLWRIGLFERYDDASGHKHYIKIAFKNKEEIVSIAKKIADVEKKDTRKNGKRFLVSSFTSKEFCEKFGEEFLDNCVIHVEAKDIKTLFAKQIIQDSLFGNIACKTQPETFEGVLNTNYDFLSQIYVLIHKSKKIPNEDKAQLFYMKFLQTMNRIENYSRYHNNISSRLDEMRCKLKKNIQTMYDDLKLLNAA